jgi:pSer/pThr/pTyr-binding forkhead associated (FHA) protein
VISCPKCAKENQDHYKFCLGCGAELPRDAAPKTFSPGTPPHGTKAVTSPRETSRGGGGLGAASAPPAAAPVAAAPPVASPMSAPTAPQGQGSGGHASAPAFGASASAPPAGEIVTCPQCGHQNSPKNVFCGSCGFRLGGAPARPAAAPAAAPSGGGGVAIILTALRADGSEAGTYALPPGTQLIGRDSGGIFSGDSYLSPRHATFRQAQGKLFIKDEASLNGVYKKLTRDVPVELKPNDVFRIGQEIIRFEPLTALAPSPDGVERLGAPSKGYVGRIALIIGRDTTGNAFPVPEAGIHLGRERGDVLFPEDGYVSGLHCHLAWDGVRLTLTDLGSSNGTFVRLREEAEVVSGDVLLMGQQLFRVSM